MVGGSDTVGLTEEVKAGYNEKLSAWGQLSRLLRKAAQGLPLEMLQTQLDKALRNVDWPCFVQKRGCNLLRFFPTPVILWLKDVHVVKISVLTSTFVLYAKMAVMGFNNTRQQGSLETYWQSLVSGLNSIASVGSIFISTCPNKADISRVLKTLA